MSVRTSQPTQCSSSVPIGTNHDAIPSTFTDYKPEQFAAINEVYKSFLRTAFSEDEIRASALPAGVDPGEPTNFLPFDEEIRAIHDNADISSESDDDSDNDSDSSDDESDNAPVAAGKKRGRKTEAQGQSQRKKGSAAVQRKESAKQRKGKKSTIAATQGGQSVAAEDAGEKMVAATLDLPTSGAAAPTPTSGVPVTPYERLELPFDLSDPSIFGSIPTSGGFSFSELHAPLPNEAVPDFMNPGLWHMEDWTFDSTASHGGDGGHGMDSVAGAPAQGSGYVDWSAVPNVTMSIPPATATWSPTTPGVMPVPGAIPGAIPGGAAMEVDSMSTVASSHQEKTITDAADTVSPVVDVSSAAAWFQGLWTYLMAEKLGEEFMLVMREWFELESTYKFANVRAGYSPKGRPEILSNWIKYGRSRVANPSITNLKMFKEHFWRWWSALQPEWREVSVEVMMPGESWESAMFPGVNGMCSIVALLRWWGEAAMGQDEEMMEWRKAVKDVVWVMRSLRSGYLG